MEEIDIIELLKRENEGKAPKEIVIKNKVFLLVPNYEVRGLQFWYSAEDNMFGEYWLDTGEINTKTKIKILDKPIIEELHKKYNVSNPKELKECVEDLGGKINEIIRHLNNEDK